MLIISVFFLITGCNDIAQEKPTSLEVSITADKENIKVNEPFTVAVDVKFGEKEINKDANVVIEIIENGMSVGSINPEYYDDKGKYGLEMMFESVGEHTLVAHVDYQEYHEMPSLLLDVTE